MDTESFEKSLRQTVGLWELGNMPSHEAMETVSRLLRDWRTLEHLSVVFPEEQSRG